MKLYYCTPLHKRIVTADQSLVGKAQAKMAKNIWAQADRRHQAILLSESFKYVSGIVKENITNGLVHNRYVNYADSKNL